VLDAAARCGLALFLTAGLAVALQVYAGRTVTDPACQRACAWFFGWCMLLIGAGWRE
jgi:hypothetical protein